MGNTPDVLVIGGGIIGLTSAYFLAKSGLTVEVIDKGEPGREASWAGAGIIPPGNFARAATPYDQLRATSSERFPALSEELRERTGIDNGYLRCGGIEFLTPDEEYAVELWRAEGIAFERAEDRLEPHLEPPPLAGYHLPGVCQVRNPWHLRALIEACQSLGVRVRTHSPIAILFPMDDYVSGALTAEREFCPAGCYLIAAGAWSGGMLNHHFRLDPGIRPVRGQMVLFRPPRPLLTRVVTVGKRYLVPRADGRILVGSTEEPEAGFEKANTPEGVAGLIAFAQQLVPALADAEVEKTWAGLRPGSPDGMPFIGPVPGFTNVFAATGHFRAGIQLSLGTAEIVTRLIRGEAPPFLIDAFRLDREPDHSARPAFRS